jgi:hypothetical protein
MNLPDAAECKAVHPLTFLDIYVAKPGRAFWKKSQEYAVIVVQLLAKLR